MKAIRTRRPGSISQLELVDTPVPAPAPTQIRVRVHATSVTRGDAVLRKMPTALLRLFRVPAKPVLGHEFAGVVDALGDDAVGFAPGARVFGSTSGTPHGAHAEYVIVDADGLVVEIPDHVGFDEAAPVPIGAMTALHFLDEAGVAAGRSVLVNGASGSVGSYAVQIARARGAHVTAVCSGRNAQLALDLGADEVIDHTATDVARLDRRFDVVFDAVGTLKKGAASRLLADGGSFVTIRTQRDETLEELLEVRDLLASGSLRAVIDREFPLERIPEAHELVESRRKRGNVLIRVVVDG